MNANSKSRIPARGNRSQSEKNGFVKTSNDSRGKTFYERYEYMRIIFFGTPEFAVPSLQVLIDAGEEIVSVITQPDRAKGRGHKLSQPPVKEHALSKGHSRYSAF